MLVQESRIYVETNRVECSDVLGLYEETPGQLERDVLM